MDGRNGTARKPVRILADENMSGRTVVLLRDAGHDVRWAAETNRSDRDSNLLELATQEARTLITYDSDYGELVHKDHLPAPYGIILFRIHNDLPDAAIEDFAARSAAVQDSWPAGLWTIQIRHRLV